MRVFLCWSAAALFALTTIVPAAAQEPERRPQRPYRGLFATGAENAEDLLSATMSLAGAYDQNLLADRLGFRPSILRNPNTGEGGWLGIGSAGLSYTHDGQVLNLRTSAGSSARAYESSPDRLLWRHNADADARVLVFPGFSLGAAAGYHPFTDGLSSLFAPSVDVGIRFAEAEDLNLLAPQDHRVTYTGSAVYTRALSRRNTASVNYAYHGSEIPHATRHFRSQAAGADLTFGLAQGMAVHAGYGYRAAIYATAAGDKAESHTINTGIDYNRPLSFSRRTTVALSTGAAGTENRTATRYRLVGMGGLRHEIGQTWEASAFYDRSTRFIDVLSDPVASDAMTFALSGFATRRLEIHFGGRVSDGDIGFGAGAKHFSAASGTANLSYALTRNLRVGADYSYSRYRFESGVALPEGWLNNVERQRVTVNMSVWMPLIQSRRADVTR